MVSSSENCGSPPPVSARTRLLSTGELGGKPTCRCFGTQAVPLVFVPRDVAHVSLPCIAVAFVSHGLCVGFGVNGHRSPMPVCMMMPAPAKLSAAVVIQ